jgi:hypothetical protein
MTPEPNAAEAKKTLRFPAIVSLAPKRRFRTNSAITFEYDETSESLVPLSAPVTRRHKLKRTGRVVLRWADPELLRGAVQAKPYIP